MDFILNKVLIALFFCLVALVTGFFLIINPALAIEIQRKFYALINWKIEPISMGKEIRNTRIMGWILVIAAILISSSLLFG